MNSKFHNCSRLSIVVVTIATTTAIASSLKPAIAYPTSQPEATSLPITLNPSGLSYTMQLQTDDIPVSESGSSPISSPPTSTAHSHLNQLAMKTDPSQPTNSEPAPATRYIWPAKGLLSSGFGWRWGRMHKGIDIGNTVCGSGSWCCGDCGLE